MPARVILHMGFHKTGTSTVQQVLRANRKVLGKHLAIRLKPQMVPLLKACRGYSTWRDPLSLAKVADRFDTLLADLPGMPKRTLVVSGEELSGHMPGRGALATYAAAAPLAEVFVRAIARRFPKAEVAIIFGTRAPDAWLRSAYWEHVKSSSLTLDFDGFAARYAEGAALDDAVDAVRSSVACDVVSTSLENCRDARFGPATPLLELCDLPQEVLEQATPVEAANTRLPQDVLQQLLQANRDHPDRDARKAAKQAIIAKATEG